MYMLDLGNTLINLAPTCLVRTENVSQKLQIALKYSKQIGI